MRKVWYWTAVPCLILLAGCKVTKYEILMIPKGDSFTREITVWDQDTSAVTQANEEELARLGKLYPERVETQDARATFRGTFEERTPNDVGGSGRYVRYRSKMGSATYYTERLGETDDVAGIQEEKIKHLDKAVDWIMGWLESELEEDPKFQASKEQLANDLRKDARNILLMFWTVQIVEQYDVESEGGQEEYIWEREIARALLYLADRDYFRPGELPKIARSVGYEDDAGFAWLQRSLARKLGYPDNQPVPASFAFLDSVEAAGESLERFLETTPEYEQLLQEGGVARKEKPDTPEPDPTDVFWELLDLFEFDLFGPDRLVKIRAVCHVSPRWSNGKWDSTAKEIVWDWHEPRGILPCIYFGAWVEPDTAFQQSHFGKVVLAGEDLEGHVFLRNALTHKEGKEWDAFLSGLKPGPELIRSIEDFTFSSEPGGPEEEKWELLDEARESLLEALSPKEPEE